MAKLVLLSAGLTGQTHELKVEKTTIGRVEDNSIQIAEPSVSSHHCEILLKGSDVVVRDLNSTNGTFINGDKVSETVLKPGQTLRLGQVEMRLEVEGGTYPPPAPSAPAPAAPAAPAPAPSKKLDQTAVISRGVKLDELEQGGKRAPFDPTSTGFSKKDNKANKIFWIAAGAFGLVIVLILVYVFVIAGK